MALSRRGFLGLGATGLVVLSLGGVALRPTKFRPALTPLRALDDRTFSVLAAFAERIAPGDGAFPPASAVRVAEKVDALLATCPPDMVAEVKQALLLFDNALASLFLNGRASTFSASDVATQDLILANWKNSRFDLRRRVYKALRGLCAGAYYGSPEVFSAIGYPGPPNFRGLLENGPTAAAPSVVDEPEAETPAAETPAPDAPQVEAP